MMIVSKGLQTVRLDCRALSSVWDLPSFLKFTIRFAADTNYEKFGLTFVAVQVATVTAMLAIKYSRLKLSASNRTIAYVDELGHEWEVYF